MKKIKEYYQRFARFAADFFELSSSSFAGSDEYKTFEKQFVLPLAFAGLFIAFVGGIISYIIGFRGILLLIPILSSISYFLVFILAKKEYVNIIYLKWILFFLTLLIINALWYFNFGSYGPAPYLFMLLYSFMIFIWKGKDLILVTLIIFINLLVLFLIELNNLDFISNYPSREAKIIDTYSALYYFGLIMFTLMSIAKTSYVRAFRQAQKSNRLKSAFLANMSHEIKTPLNSIVGFTQLLNEENHSKEEKQKYMRIIQQSNQTLLQLIKDIIDASLVESNQLEVKLKEVNITRLLMGMKETYSMVLKDKNKSGVVLEADVPNENYLVETDEIRLQQVLTNLLNNAVKYTNDGIISFGFKELTGELEFYVKDTGRGISEKEQERLFERFYRGKGEENKDKINKGSGIGLFLSKNIINMLGGRIWVESKEGEGSTFYFTIPKQKFRKSPGPPLMIEKRKKEKEPVPVPRKKLKILLVEDHPESMMLLTKMLHDLKPEIFQAFDGKSAVELFRSHRDIDLVLLDLKIPEMSGYEVIKEIRRLDKRIPVLAQTAFAYEKDKMAVYNAGFNGFITKPIDKEVLLDAIRGMGII